MLWWMVLLLFLSSGDCSGPSGSGAPDRVVCEVLEPLAEDACTVVPGGDGLLVRGDVFGVDALYVGGQLWVDGSGVIGCVGCDCAEQASGATELVCPEAAVSPGLINLHEHLSFQTPPVPDSGERYEHRHDWRIGANGHTAISVSGQASLAEQQWGELRHLLAGTTSIVGASTVPGLLRNLDGSGQEGLDQPVIFRETFPLGDAAGQQLASGCDYPSIQTAFLVSFFEAYVPHLGEGIDANARNEFLCTRETVGGGQDLLESQSAYVHATGLEAADYAEMAAEGTSLVWSPRSNVRLYGDTASVALADRLGVNVALGTDWLATGSMNLQRELRCASEWNRQRLDRHFGEYELWKMVTANAAEAVAVDDAIGSLAPGLVADVAIFDGAGRRGYRAAVSAGPERVLLVLRGGEPLYGEASLLAALSPESCDSLAVCGAEKALCIADELGMSLAELDAAVGDAYPLFYCGTPDDEPTCHPERAHSVSGSTPYTGELRWFDSDGDGLENDEDLCPRAFDPVRPLDAGEQADADGDGLGDVCDPEPLGGAAEADTGVS